MYSPALVHVVFARNRGNQQGVISAALLPRLCRARARDGLEPLAELKQQLQPDAQLMVEEVGVLAVLLPEQPHRQLANVEHRISLKPGAYNRSLYSLT